MLLARFTGLTLLGMVLLGLGLGKEKPFSSPLEPNIDPRVASDLSSVVERGDTLRPSIEAGDPLLLALPTQLEGAPVDHYALIQGPSLSGVAGHSFTWMTQSVEPGTYDVLLRAVRPESSPDTLVLRVEVQN